jgi:hypothetical protein
MAELYRHSSKGLDGAVLAGPLELARWSLGTTLDMSDAQMPHVSCVVLNGNVLSVI